MRMYVLCDVLYEEIGRREKLPLHTPALPLNCVQIWRSVFGVGNHLTNPLSHIGTHVDNSVLAAGDVERTCILRYDMRSI